MELNLVALVITILVVVFAQGFVLKLGIPAVKETTGRSRQLDILLLVWSTQFALMMIIAFIVVYNRQT